MSTRAEKYGLTSVTLRLSEEYIVLRTRKSIRTTGMIRHKDTVATRMRIRLAVVFHMIQQLREILNKHAIPFSLTSTIYLVALPRTMPEIQLRRVLFG